MKALVVGRFQPFHKGHEKMVEYVASNVDELVVGVGSSNKSGSFENPYTFQERVQMIKKSLDLSVALQVKAIPDFDEDDLWLDYILENIDFDLVYTNSENEKRIFESRNISVKSIPFFDRNRFMATKVRKRMVEDSSWEKLVPEGTLNVLEEISGVEKIKKYVG